jgi:hypothetical protein
VVGVKADDLWVSGQLIRDVVLVFDYDPDDVLADGRVWEQFGYYVDNKTRQPYYFNFPDGSQQPTTLRDFVESVCESDFSFLEYLTWVADGNSDELGLFDKHNLPSAKDVQLAASIAAEQLLLWMTSQLKE